MLVIIVNCAGEVVANIFPKVRVVDATLVVDDAFGFVTINRVVVGVVVPRATVFANVEVAVVEVATRFPTVSCGVPVATKLDPL